MRTVTFGMIWQMAGEQTIELPDEIDEDDVDAIEEYIRDNWDDIPLPPSGSYISYSAELDDCCDFDVSEG